MELKIIDFRTKHTEESITRIGAKVADAVRLSQEAKELFANSEALLIDIQQELEELYVTITDFPIKPTKATDN